MKRIRFSLRTFLIASIVIGVVLGLAAMIPLPRGQISEFGAAAIFVALPGLVGYLAATLVERTGSDRLRALAYTIVCIPLNAACWFVYGIGIAFAENQRVGEPAYLLQALQWSHHAHAIDFVALGILLGLAASLFFKRPAIGQRVGTGGLAFWFILFVFGYLAAMVSLAPVTTILP